MAREKRMVTIMSSKTGQPLVCDKQQRNEKCDCGSGKKCKKCCGATQRYYDTGKVREALKPKVEEPETVAPESEINTSE